MPKQVVFASVTFLHDLFTAVWVGGLITLGIAVLPASRQTLGKGPQMRALMALIQRRLSVLVYISMVGLILTGMLLSNRAPAFKGLFRFSNPYSTVLTIKHVLVVLMIGIALFRSLVLGGGRESSTPNQERLTAGLMFLNMTLGVLIVLLSGLSATFSTGPVG